ncbi:MAG: S-adenosylmethionine:tRNA ribosyltransferase-isomerase [Acidimicrobiales bacterium]
MTAAMATASHGLEFDLPPELEAGEPPEARGVDRDGVRLMVANRESGRLTHTTFGALSEILEPGDLVVVNTSATIPASVSGRTPAGDVLDAHLGPRFPGGAFLVELRRPTPPASLPYGDGWAGLHLDLPAGGSLDTLCPYPAGGPGLTTLPSRPAGPAPAGSWPATDPVTGRHRTGPRHGREAKSTTRLWLAAVHLPGGPTAYLGAHGQPIRYGYSRRAWPLRTYQTVYAGEPGSAEMPSAGRPFSNRLLTRLVAAGISVAPLLLHAGLSSLEAHERPCPEHYDVPSETAERVNDAHRRGHRVVAVGTTVVRALETVADVGGRAHPGAGWTELVVTPERGVRVVDGLVTGWHEPRASHLDLLEGVAGRSLLEASYRAALDQGYLWHELGDSHLILHR